MKIGSGGEEVEEGGFEPLGTDYQANTPAGASDSAVYLRLPGQWEEDPWTEAIGKIDPALGFVYRPQGGPGREFCTYEHE